MSVTTALHTGISGLFTNGEAMSVIGNNIANVNTVGFKEARTLFSDMLSTNINKGQIGRGEQIQAVENLFSQGSFENSQNATDLAIQGDGLFVLQDPNGAGRFFSRAGAFNFDKDKILSNSDGYKVLGYGIRNGQADGVLAPVDLTNFANVAPQPTSVIRMLVNLDATQTTPEAWDPAAAGFNPILASNFSTSTTIFDASGNSNSVSLYFRKTAADAWEVFSYDGTTYSAAGAGTPITFDPSSGALATINGTPMNDVPPPTVTVGGMSVDLRGATQYTSGSTVFSQSQDGFGAGNLMKISVDEKGYVNGMYSNGQMQRIAQVAVARFSAPNQLEKVGGSLYGETSGSGTALIDASGVESNKILSHSLEQSNVDMADQLVRMITTQRAYSANSKTITTADEMLQETLNLKR